LADAAARNTPMKQRERILDDKRSRQLAVMLARFPPLNVIDDAMRNCDLDILKPERIRIMLETVSTWLC
jgi:hypothetical protein